MRLARKLILALVVSVFAVLAAFAWVRLEREVSLFDDDIRRDHARIATSLGIATASLWRSSGRERALALVREADRQRPGIGLRWVSPDAGDEYAPLVPEAARAALARGELVHAPLQGRLAHGRVEPSPDGDEYLVSYRPVDPHASDLGMLELNESLIRKREYIDATVFNLTVAMLLVLTLITGIILALGTWLVGRPMGLLVEKARRVGAGDLTGPLELRQRDEIGELAREMNAMCERLSEAHTRIERETAARIETLEQLRHADRLMTVGKLAAGIAHELGTPLNVVSGRARMIARGKAQGDAITEYARIIAEQSDRMAKIIRQLLDFARVRQPKRVRHDLRSVAEEAVHLVSPLADKRGVSLVVEGGSLPADVDAGQLLQAVTNLVVNALHASEPGQTVRIELELETAPDGGPRALLRVVDQGHGIAPDALDSIFEPFYTTKPVGEGTGLGLSVSEGIAREHGGLIEVESAPGIGSTFTLVIPVEEP
jgi:two-component system, NtrC family, sensor kinase